jgi:hypothetical protein
VSRSSARKSASPAAQSASRSARAAAFSSRMARSSVSRSPPIPPAWVATFCHIFHARQSRFAGR